MSTVIMQVLSQVAIPKPTNFHHKLFNISSKRCRFINTSVRTHGIRVRCSVKVSDEIQTGRRSGGYQPALWNFDTIQSLNATSHHYNEGSNLKRAAVLTAQVQKMLQQQEGEDDEVDRIRRLELVDDLRKLGISHHFDEEIANFLNYLDFKQRDLYSTALGFRLLRQNGVSVSQEVFDCFKNEEGSDFKLELCNDTKGLLQLYEASFVSTQGEETLEVAREFATKFLQKKLDHNEIDDKYLLSSVQEALAFPIHWKVQMPNAIPFIDAYKTKPHANPVVLELAQLDIDIVQAQFQEELKQASRWWNNTCLVQQLPFVRDRIVECYYWSTGVVERRQHGYERIMLTKIIALVTTIDDIYDVYGTLEELRLFTSDIRRWDTESMKQLPTYMQLCYLALYNFVNESAYDTLKEKGFNSIPYLHKTWVDLVESYMREAEWYYNGYKPSTDEYIDNAWISVGGIQILTHLFFRLTDFITMEIVETSMHKYHDLDRASCTILRLADDLGTSLDEVERGDVPKSVQCYMNEKNCSEEEAREHMRGLIAQMWKMMNKEMMTSADSPFSEYYVEVAANLARMAQCIYQQECDGFGMQHSLVNKMLTELLFDSYMSHNSVRA